ncbi:hypothetical protein [Kaarinaea lacus]
MVKINEHKIHYQIFLSPVFLLTLFTLAANDLYLKAAYPGWVTGKLSDISGLFLVSLFVLAFYQRHKIITAASIIVAFIVWKSPLAQSGIDLWNSWLPTFAIQRIVDMSDLIALPLVPLAYFYFTYSSTHANIQIQQKQKFFALPFILLSLVAITGTSMINYQDRFYIRKSDETSNFSTAKAKQIIYSVANEYDLYCRVCRDESLDGEYADKHIVMKYSIDKSKRSISFELSGTPDSFLSNTTDSRMDNIREALKYKLGNQFDHMEFVIPLPEKPFLY